MEMFFSIDYQMKTFKNIKNKLKSVPKWFILIYTVSYYAE